MGGGLAAKLIMFSQLKEWTHLGLEIIVTIGLYNLHFLLTVYCISIQLRLLLCCMHYVWRYCMFPEFNES